MEFSRFSGICGIVYFTFFSKPVRSISGIVFLIILLSFIADCSNFFFIRLTGYNGYAIGNIWYIVNFILSVYLFALLIPNNRKLLFGLLSFFSLGTIISYATIYSLLDSNSFVKVATSITFTFLSLKVYFDLLKSPSGLLSKNPVFWIATAYLLFSSVTLLRNLFLQFLVFELEISKETSATIFIIYLLANISKNFILFYALVLIDKGYPDTLKRAKA